MGNDNSTMNGCCCSRQEKEKTPKKDKDGELDNSDFSQNSNTSTFDLQKKIYSSPRLKLEI